MKTRILFTASLALALACSPTLFAADKKGEKKPLPASEKAPDPGKTPEATPKPETAARSLPFTGKVTAVDAGGKSISLKGKAKDRVFAVTDKTVVLGKDNAPAKVSDIKVGDEVRGSALKNGEEWTAVKVFLGAKEKKAAVGEAAAKPEAAKKP